MLTFVCKVFTIASILLISTIVVNSVYAEKPKFDLTSSTGVYCNKLWDQIQDHRDKGETTQADEKAAHYEEICSPIYGGKPRVLQETGIDIGKGADVLSALPNTGSVDTNDRNEAILIDRGMFLNNNSTDNTNNNKTKNSKFLSQNISPNILTGRGIKTDPSPTKEGVSPYVGDPDTWCKINFDGSRTCTCKAGTTDCLHMCGLIDCPSDCVAKTGDCKVELPRASSSDTVMPGKSKTQGTFDPGLTTGTGGKLSADTESKTEVIPKYSCSGDTCKCTGDADCNEMFSSNACTEDIFEPTSCIDDTCTCTSAAAK